MKYKYEFMPMKAIGQLFGETSHKVGKWLQTIGLRDIEGKPTNQAYSGGFIEQRFFNNCYTNYWHTVKTVEELKRAGHQPIPNPPEDLVKHESINPPFSMQKNLWNGYNILNGDGSIAMTVYGEKNAKRMEHFLKMASGMPTKFNELFPKE